MSGYMQQKKNRWRFKSTLNWFNERECSRRAGRSEFQTEGSDDRKLRGP